MKRSRQRSLMAFDSPWLFEPGTVRVFAPAAADSREVSRQFHAGEHRTPFMLESASERQLMFARANVQSTMCIDDPDALMCAYTQEMMAFLLFNPVPSHIVAIGLGGGSLPKFCYRYLPGSRITAVEIDADVIALREEFCIPADNQRFRVVHDDGARFMSTLNEPVDVILVDAFDARGLAPALIASNFYSDAASRLAADGILVLNLSGESRRIPVHLGRLRAAFGDRLLTLTVASSDNVLVFAFNSQAPRGITAKLETRAKHLQRQLKLQFPRYLQRLYEGPLVREKRL